jgi:acyl carrier protein
MTSDQLTVVRAIVSILEKKPNYKPLHPDQFLEMSIDDLGLDSVEKLDLVMDLEERFDLVFTTSEVTKCRTIDEIVKCIRGEKASD